MRTGLVKGQSKLAEELYRVSIVVWQEAFRRPSHDVRLNMVQKEALDANNIEDSRFGLALNAGALFGIQGVQHFVCYSRL